MVTALKKYKQHYTDLVNKSESYSPNDLLILSQSIHSFPQYAIVRKNSPHHDVTDHFSYYDFPVPHFNHGGVNVIELISSSQEGLIPHTASLIEWMPGNEVMPFTEVSFQEPKSSLEAAIEDATDILSLPDNWNEEGAKQIPKEIFSAAINFLRTYSDYLAKVHQLALDVPEINPVSDGTIDLSWRTKHARMLINIRNIDNIPHAFFYGDRYNNRTPVKGNTPVAEFSEALAAWMKSLSA